ncbi:ATP-binding protein [Mucilaginibacter sp. cycad4]|uniref:ATP-binding protein n=1 Tax=Mucilaginibacter sp. cycad4 TaxID=3342096 RepID=UPI002AAB2CD7|nr:ATP-binding protein [Mucilaginibacter gossypii]WPU99907.1 ATP-binding protein [Mucilaginibacter gossypii]
MSKNRYLGLRSFEEDDEALFFGREKESAQLASIIYFERFLVLFGKSGVGKSSLLNTLYKKNDILKSFKPVRIRFQPREVHEAPIKDEAAENIKRGSDTFETKDEPLEIVKCELESFFKKEGLVYDINQIVFNKDSYSLWELVKLAEVTTKNHSNFTIVLVFDQFEEFFSLPLDTQNKFSLQLAEVLHELPPTRILDWIAKKEDSERTPEILEWYMQPNIKVVFSIRSDRLYQLGNLISFIPNILGSRMELKHFNGSNAVEAIMKPAWLDGSFKSPKIDFKGDIPGKIAKSVINEFNEVDSSLLQVICYSVEEKVIEKNKENQSNPYEFTEDEFNTEVNLGQILDTFYLTQTGKLGDAAEVDFARQVIEDHFVEKGERVGLSRNQLLNRLNENTALLEKLLNARLIREEETGRGARYELIHDKLIATVQKRKDIREREVKYRERIEEQELKRREEEEKRKEEELRRAARARLISRIYILGFASAVTVAMGFIFYFIAGSSINSILNDRANDAYVHNNHYLAFLYANKLRSNIYYSSEKGKDIQAFDKKFLYDISGGDEVVTVDSVTVAVHYTDNTIYIWKINDACIKGRGKLVLDTIINSAMNMIVSKVGRFAAYRDTSGLINVYDIQQRKNSFVKGSRLNSVSFGNNPLISSNIADFKMDFLDKSPWLAFMNVDGNFKIYDAGRKKLLGYIYLSYENKYQSKDIKDLFLYSPGSNYILTRKPKSKKINFWDMTGKIVDKNLVKNVENAFATSKKGLFAYIRKDHKVFLYDITSLDNLNRDNSELIASNVETMIPSKDGSKAIFFFKGKLMVYDFEQKRFDTRFNQNTKLYQRFKSVKFNSNLIRWTESGDKFTLNILSSPVIIDLAKATSFRMFNDKDTSVILDSRLNNYVISEDEERYAYINQKGYLIIKAVDSEASKIADKRWRIFNQDSIWSSRSLFTLDQLCRFSSSGKYFAFIKPGVTNKLTIVNLITGEEKVQNYPVKKIGRYFTDSYIQVASTFDNAGGIVFINDIVRNRNYYKTIFPELTKGTEKLINLK